MSSAAATGRRTGWSPTCARGAGRRAAAAAQSASDAPLAACAGAAGRLSASMPSGWRAEPTIPAALNFGPPPDDVLTVAEVAQRDARRDAMPRSAGSCAEAAAAAKRRISLAIDPALAKTALGWQPRLQSSTGAAMDRRLVSRGHGEGDDPRAVCARADRPLRGAGMTAAAQPASACGAPLTRTFVDLGHTPLANSFVPAGSAASPIRAIPLHARVCDRCLLVQVEPVVPPAEIFSDYAYFSSYSDSWVEHCRAYAEMAIAALRALGRQQGGRDRQQRRLSAEEFRRRRHSLPRHRAGRQRGAGGARPRACRPRSRFFGSETARRLARAPATAPICWSPTTCWPTCPTSTISSPASASC